MASVNGDDEEVVLNRVLTAPNAISFARLLLVPVFLLLYVVGRVLPAMIVIIAVLVAYSIKGTVPWWLSSVIVARDVIIMVAFAVFEKRGLPRLPVNRTGKRATAALFTGMGAISISVVMKVSGVAALKSGANGMRIV